MEINIVKDCKEGKLGGLPRYESSLVTSLKRNIDIKVIHASELPKPNRIKQLVNFFISPKNKSDKKTINHLLNQQLALSLNFVNIPNVIVTVHDLAFIIPKYFRELSFTEKMRYFLVMRGLGRVKRVIVDVPFTKNEIIRYLKIPSNKIDVVPLGIDHSMFKRIRLGKNRGLYRHYEDAKIILYVGSEIRRMNFQNLIKAFYDVKTKIPNAKIIKIGDSGRPSERKRVLSLIKELGLHEDIFFAGRVSEDDLVRYYNAADLFVYPIEYTGFGFPPLEAMACGCPVICSNSSCLPEVVGDAALLFDPKDVRQLSNNIFKLLTDGRVRREMIKKGLKHSRSFTWEKCAKDTICAYKRFMCELDQPNTKAKQ